MIMDKMFGVLLILAAAILLKCSVEEWLKRTREARLKRAKARRQKRLDNKFWKDLEEMNKEIDRESKKKRQNIVYKGLPEYKSAWVK